MSQSVDPTIRQAFESSGGKLACKYCGRTFTMKPDGMKGHVVFPYHNVARRSSKLDPLPARCHGSDIPVRVETDEEVDAASEAFLAELKNTAE